MQLVNVNELQIGQTIAADVSNANGQVILAAGTVICRLHATLLKAWAITRVPVQDGPTPGPGATILAGAPSEPEGFESIANRQDHPALVALATVATQVAEKTGASPVMLLNGNLSVASFRETAKPSGPPISPETIAAKAGNLASLPSVYSRLEKTINNPSSSAADITKILRNDPGLIARLLRIANSAFYGFPRKVEGLEEAVRIIGTRQLQDLVLATVVLTQFKGVNARLVDMRSFWRHSLACGIAARSFAKLRRETNTERFFVAGLLHDIGSLVLYQQVPERAQTALERHRSTAIALEDAERSSIGCDHGAVGAAIMSLWKLPEFFRDTAAGHHNSGYRARTAGTAVIHLADLLALALGLGNNGEIRLPRFSADAWRLVGLEPDCIELVASEVVSHLAEAERMFVSDELAA